MVRSENCLSSWDFETRRIFSNSRRGHIIKLRFFSKDFDRFSKVGEVFQRTFVFNRGISPKVLHRQGVWACNLGLVKVRLELAAHRPGLWRSRSLMGQRWSRRTYRFNFIKVAQTLIAVLSPLQLRLVRAGRNIGLVQLWEEVYVLIVAHYLCHQRYVLVIASVDVDAPLVVVLLVLSEFVNED